MATEYRLSYTASEIDERLGKIDEHTTELNELSETLNKQIGGTVEIIDGVPTKEKTVLTVNPSAEEVEIYTSPEVDVKIDALKEQIADYNTLAYGICESEGAVADKIVTIDKDNWELKVGNVVMIKFINYNSVTKVTLNVNNTGAYPIWYNASQYNGAVATYTGYPNRVTTYMFNGTHWVWISNGFDNNTTYTNASLGQGYATCTTAGATTAKVATLSGYTLTLGGIVSVKFTYGVPASATLNIASKGAKAIYYRGVVITSDVIKAGDIATFVYDGTQYHLISIDRWQEDIDEFSEQFVDYVVQDYVVMEANEVIDRVLDAQGTRTFNMIVMTDLHNNGGESDVQILHACQGAGIVADRVKVDAYASLGDHTDNLASSSWADGQADMEAINTHTHKNLRNMDEFRLIGNHDFKESRSPKIFKLISAFSKGVEWGDRLGCYFSKDYEEYKLRIICMNTSDEGYINISNSQYNWLIERLDLSAKEDASEWQILILSHVPLDWSTFTVPAYVLQAYLNGTSWTNGTISCDFTDKNQATIIATIHGHIHNLMYTKLKTNDGTEIDLYRIAIPEVTELYSNHYSVPFKNSITYSKTANSANDTSFNVLCIDLDSKKIEAICYGAGVDRTIEYTVFDGEQEEPSVGYKNLLPTALGNNGLVLKNADGEELGYADGYYLSGSASQPFNNMTYASVDASTFITGYIPYTREQALSGIPIYVKGATLNTSVDHNRIGMYPSYDYLAYLSPINAPAWNTYFTVTELGNQYYKIVPLQALINYYDEKIDNFEYVRFSFTGSGSGVIITVNEEITDTPTGGYTNVIDTVGYIDNARPNSSGTTSTLEGYTVTNIIDISAYTDPVTIRTKGVDFTYSDNCYIAMHKADGSQITYTTINNLIEHTESDGNWNGFSITADEEGNLVITTGSNSANYFRIGGYGSGANLIVTINEEITDTSYTNQIPLSVNADGTDYVGANGEDGYSAGYRVNSSGTEVAQDGMCVTGFIPYSDNTMRLTNVTISGTKDSYLALYYQDGSFWQVKALTDVLVDDGNGVYTGSIVHTGWIRITCGVIDDTSILTFDEEII